MQAQIGDYIAMPQYSNYYARVLSKVVAVGISATGTEEYVTEGGAIVDESELGLEDVLLESEVEVG